jgi:hypothetical protein
MAVLLSCAAVLLLLFLISGMKFVTERWFVGLQVAIVFVVLFGFTYFFYWILP